jgi:hypothetical protein
MRHGEETSRRTEETFWEDEQKNFTTKTTNDGKI